MNVKLIINWILFQNIPKVEDRNTTDYKTYGEELGGSNVSLLASGQSTECFNDVTCRLHIFCFATYHESDIFLEGHETISVWSDKHNANC